MVSLWKNATASHSRTPWKFPAYWACASNCTSAAARCKTVSVQWPKPHRCTTCAAELSIGDAAAQWGFFHLSHFAQEYQLLFGELPSRTARAKLPATIAS